jgi:hypothetical protein
MTAGETETPRRRPVATHADDIHTARPLLAQPAPTWVAVSRAAAAIEPRARIACLTAFDPTPSRRTSTEREDRRGSTPGDGLVHFYVETPFRCRRFSMSSTTMDGETETPRRLPVAPARHSPNERRRHSLGANPSGSIGPNFGSRSQRAGGSTKRRRSRRAAKRRYRDD